MEKSNIKILLAILAILVTISIVIVVKKPSTKKEIIEEEHSNTTENDNIIIGEIENKEIKTYNGNERPIAVMIDNHKGAWPQYGIQEAYMVYEIIVEGGETRLMALFKGKDVPQIGPVRSARHYFIDYAMENDAIYTHFGESPQARRDIKRFSIDEISGISKDEEAFLRIKTKKSPHNVITSTEKILEAAKKQKIRTKSNNKSVLNYSTEEIELMDGIDAKCIKIPHSTLQKVKYEYDAKSKKYIRYAREKEQRDEQTGKAITVKNIIITLCDNYTLEDSEEKGRQGLKNIGVFDGYYITNGKAIKIKCKKENRDSKTIYQDLEGNEIKVNDGNTFINICPKESKIEFLEDGKEEK